MDRKSERVIDWAAVRLAYEASGDPLNIIAGRHGISESTIDRRRAKEGWPKRRDTRRIGRRRDPNPQSDGVDWAEVRREYDGGEYSVWEICVRHGFGKSSLYRRKNLENWKARCPGHPKAYGAGRMVNATQRLKALVEGKLAALEGRLGPGEKIDVGDPLKGLNTLANAYEKLLEAREKSDDDSDRLRINDASRNALAERIEALVDSWERKGNSAGSGCTAAGAD